MRKIRIFEHISLDGVIEHGEDYAYGGWDGTVSKPGWAGGRHRGTRHEL